MIDRQILMRPLTAVGADWLPEEAFRAWQSFRRWTKPARERVKAMARQVVAFIEPALEWLARQRWLGANISSVVGKILALNLLGLGLLTLAILFFSPVQASLVQSKLESLMSEATILSSAIGASATRESDRLALSPELLEPSNNAELKQALPERALQFPIRPERVGALTRQLIGPSALRLRLFRPDGTFMYDSREQPGDAASAGPQDTNLITSFWTRLSDWMDGTDLPVYRDIGRANFSFYPEFAEALKTGQPKAMLLMNDKGKRTVTIIAPVKRRDNLANLILSTRDGEIDKLVWTERRTVLWLGGLGLLAMALTSLLLAGTIALPLHQLAQAADHVQGNLRRRQELPDFSYRQDEIAHLSSTLRNMTDALYKRVEASERFAADVAHELKNPLTSVRSAAETLARVKNDADRKILTDTIQNDVKRLTRLIDDISKATRADAEMALSDAAPVDLSGMLGTLAEMFNSMHVADGQKVVLEVAPSTLPADEAYAVQGHDIRLGQVFKNLLDNALSFSPSPGTVWIRMQRGEQSIHIAVEDQGPGIPADKFDKIFNRFYTDRPVASFGNNSGLGLSICLEIVKAHHGQIRAENRIENTVQRSGPSDLGVVETRISGARFLIDLPAAKQQPLVRVTPARSVARR
jgi:two-component system, OmpR family, sensor histidine kinase ChvG